MEEVKNQTHQNFFLPYDGFIKNEQKTLVPGNGKILKKNFEIEGNEFNIGLSYLATHANKTEAECRSLVEEASVRVSIAVAVCGAIIVIFYFIHIFLFTIVADRLTRKVRLLAFENILRQNIGYFDVNFSGELNTRLTQ